MLCNLTLIHLWLPQLDFLLNILNIFIFILYLKKINITHIKTWIFNNNIFAIPQLHNFYFKTNNYAYNFYSFFTCVILCIFVYNRLFSFQTIASSNNLINISFTSNLNILFITFLTAIIFLGYLNYNTIKPIHIEANLLILLSIIGLDMMVVSSNIVLFYLSLELQNFCLICLCGLHLTNAYSIEAALKMYLLGSYSSSLIVLSCAGLFFQTGSLLWHNIFDYTSFFLNNNISTWIFLFMIGLLWKLGAAPVHLWLVDIIINTRLFINVFITIVPKIAIFSLFVNKISYFINIQNINILSIITILCLLIGPLYAINQVELRSIIAFSSIGQMGFILISLFINKFFILWLNIFFYLLSLLFIWLCISLQRNFIYTTNYKNINNNLINCLTLITVVLCLAGLPPLPTFFAKIFVMQAALDAGQFLFVSLSIISTTFSVFYSVKLLQYIIQPNKQLFLTQNNNSDSLLCFILTILGSFLFSIFWYMQPIYNFIIFNYI
jgi:NADH-quinone oxidoreductase subunit N